MMVLQHPPLVLIGIVLIQLNYASPTRPKCTADKGRNHKLEITGKDCLCIALVINVVCYSSHISSTPVAG